jgi:IS30 family transposase
VVEDRAVPGHWEGDLLAGTRNAYIATLVERHSRCVCLVRVTTKETQAVVRALTQQVQRVPDGLITTLTWDRGLELAALRLNTRPRKTLGYRTPAVTLAEAVASTG